MDILMVTAELAPYARATRAGDTVAALSKALCQLEHRVTVAVPRHPGFESSGLLAARRLTPLVLEGGAEVTVLDAQLPTGATLVLFDAPGLFDRPAVYGEGSDYPDNAARFAFLCEATAALVRQRAEREPFDVVHLHGWPAAALAVTLPGFAPKVASVLTVHDGGRRGIVTAKELAQFGIDRPDDSCREAGGVSLLACAARAADAVTAVSSTVASDLVDPARFGALARAVAARATPVTGIASGLDYAVYNPATDAALKSRYDAEDTANKGSSKTELVRSRKLELDLARPLVAVIVGSGPDGGGDLLEQALDPILKSDLALLIVDRGDAPLSRVKELLAEFGDRLTVERSRDEALIRRACAAADLVLLPSTYEATATFARVAQRYGALPIGRAAGANVEAIVDCDADLETGTGFLFEEPTAAAMVGALARGLAAYSSPRWSMLRRRVMRLDLACDRPARRYVQVYRQAIAARALATPG
jgi:starch synthase